MRSTINDCSHSRRSSDTAGKLAATGSRTYTSKPQSNLGSISAMPHNVSETRSIRTARADRPKPGPKDTSNWTKFAILSSKQKCPESPPKSRRKTGCGTTLSTKSPVHPTIPVKTTALPKAIAAPFRPLWSRSRRNPLRRVDGTPAVRGHGKLLPLTAQTTSIVVGTSVKQDLRGFVSNVRHTDKSGISGCCRIWPYVKFSEWRHHNGLVFQNRNSYGFGFEDKASPVS